jgi:hypothetical protein
VAQAGVLFASPWPDVDIGQTLRKSIDPITKPVDRRKAGHANVTPHARPSGGRPKPGSFASFRDHPKRSATLFRRLGPRLARRPVAKSGPHCRVHAGRKWLGIEAPADACQFHSRQLDRCGRIVRHHFRGDGRWARFHRHSPWFWSRGRDGPQSRTIMVASSTACGRAHTGGIRLEA